MRMKCAGTPRECVAFEPGRRAAQQAWQHGGIESAGTQVAWAKGMHERPLHDARIAPGLAHRQARKARRALSKLVSRNLEQLLCLVSISCAAQHGRHRGPQRCELRAPDGHSSRTSRVRAQMKRDRGSARKRSLSDTALARSASNGETIRQKVGAGSSKNRDWNRGARTLKVAKASEATSNVATCTYSKNAARNNTGSGDRASFWLTEADWRKAERVNQPATPHAAEVDQHEAASAQPQATNRRQGSRKAEM